MLSVSVRLGLLNLAIKLCIAAMQKTLNSSGWQVIADLHFKNPIIRLQKTVWQIETALTLTQSLPEGKCYFASRGKKRSVYFTRHFYAKNSTQ